MSVHASEDDHKSVASGEDVYVQINPLPMERNVKVNLLSSMPATKPEAADGSLIFP